MNEPLGLALSGIAVLIIIIIIYIYWNKPAATQDDKNKKKKQVYTNIIKNVDTKFNPEGEMKIKHENQPPEYFSPDMSELQTIDPNHISKVIRDMNLEPSVTSRQLEWYNNAKKYSQSPARGVEPLDISNNISWSGIIRPDPVPQTHNFEQVTDMGPNDMDHSRMRMCYSS